MVFSSLIFLFLFLPIVLLGYMLMRNTIARNAFLLFASLFFYAWGELSFLWVMLASICLNYGFAIIISDTREPALKKLALAGAVIVNLGLLAFFKYAGFVETNVNHLLELGHFPLLTGKAPPLPLGISFFTFHSLSYVIDVYRGQAQAQRNPINLALYISLFPQLIAGPIIRYHDVCDQLTERTITVNKFAEGVRRFVTGLGKKMLIANVVAVPADQIFGLPGSELSTSLAWLGCVCYTLQIYFDFSGYSDMAIGLGLMFGFRFLENFNFPYISQSIREFWQRWHISLSNWFRDYLYIPLGGNRCSDPRVALNLLIVFFLCGLWHGASWSFIVWGLYHGTFLGLERAGLGKLVASLARPLRHFYALFVVMIGWVFFRADDLKHAIMYLKTMFGLHSGGTGYYTVPIIMNKEVAFVILLGIIGSTPLIRNWLLRPGLQIGGETVQVPSYSARWLPAARVAFVSVVLGLAVMEMASGTYNPFIYFRF
jgi:alginate O-acetyltransferase complex protein AlgI